MQLNQQSKHSGLVIDIDHPKIYNLYKFLISVQM